MLSLRDTNSSEDIGEFRHFGHEWSREAGMVRQPRILISLLVLLRGQLRNGHFFLSFSWSRFSASPCPGSALSSTGAIWSLLSPLISEEILFLVQNSTAQCHKAQAMIFPLWNKWPPSLQCFAIPMGHLSHLFKGFILMRKQCAIMSRYIEHNAFARILSIGFHLG